MFSWLLIPLACACGSLPFGVWIGGLAGVDVRRAGSGNIGATNVARIAGLRLGLLTLIADILKAALPVYLALRVNAPPSVVDLSGLAAFLGHLYSPLLRGKGGKGVATAVGVFVVLAPWAVVAALATFAPVVGLSRYVSLASLVGAVTLAVSCWLVYPPDIGLLGALIASLIIWRHRSNIKRLRAGQEPKFGAPK